MFCRNCGKELNEKAVVCVNCGAAVNEQSFNQNNITNNSPKKGKGIASMVLGIIALFYVLVAFLSIGEIDNEISSYSSSSEVIAFAIGFVLIQSICATLAICLSASERKKFKNGFNTSGFWLSIVTFIMVAIQFIIVVTY